MARTITRPQAQALRAARNEGHLTAPEFPAGHPLHDRYSLTLDCRANTRNALVRLGLVEGITHTENGQEVTDYVLTYAGELIAVHCDDVTNLPRLDMIAAYVADSVRPEPAPRCEWTGGLVAWGKGPLSCAGDNGAPKLAVHRVHGVALCGFHSPYDVTPDNAERFPLEAAPWAVEGAPWAVEGARATFPASGPATVTRREGNGRDAFVYAVADSNGVEYGVAADSPLLARLCNRCDTVGDDTMPARETNGRYLCGYCAAQEEPHTYPADTETVRFVAASALKPGDRIMNGHDDDMLVKSTRTVTTTTRYGQPCEPEDVTNVVYTVNGREYSGLWDDRHAMPVRRS